MRILMTTRGSAGHVLPLAPLGHASRRAGHEVLVVAQHHNEHNVSRTGLPFAGVDAPPDEAWMPVLADFGRLDIDAANARMVGEYFGRLDTTAALPGLEAIVARWRPDVIVRESFEFASTLVAERHGIPVVRVALGLAAMEHWATGLAAPVLDELRRELGLPPDPDGDRLRDTPFITTVPEPLEDPAVPAPQRTHRFRHGSHAQAPGGASPWAAEDPLVYVSFGSVTAGAHLPYFPALYGTVLDALASLPARVLLTVGEGRDLGELGRVPANVRVERWVPQDEVLPHAALAVSHGGHGSTLGALVHGVPLVVLPLFSGDQWENATAVDRAGAGLAVGLHRRSGGVLDLPDPASIEALGVAVRTVLSDRSFAHGARAIAQAMAALAPVEDAVEVLAAAAASRAAA